MATSAPNVAADGVVICWSSSVRISRNSRRLRPASAGVVIVDRAVGNSDRGWQIATELGAEQVAVLPAAEAWLIDRLAEVGLGTVRQHPSLNDPGACGVRGRVRS